MSKIRDEAPIKTAFGRHRKWAAILVLLVAPLFLFGAAAAWRVARSQKGRLEKQEEAVEDAKQSGLALARFMSRDQASGLADMVGKHEAELAAAKRAQLGLKVTAALNAALCLIFISLGAVANGRPFGMAVAALVLYVVLLAAEVSATAMRGRQFFSWPGLLIMVVPLVFLLLALRHGLAARRLAVWAPRAAEAEEAEQAQ